MKFIDEVKIEAHGGRGGSGVVSWRRESHVPRGGPDGGDAGNGGAVILVADPSINTLIDFSFTPILKAKSGGDGGSNGLTGADGKDLVKLVPMGTQVYYEGELVADLPVAGARWIAARGGRGGRGNAYFKSATKQAPDYAQPGQPGESVQYRLVLKSVADVGLVGFPNVGKSTLISAISAATPKVADYPFTTIEPHLGVVLVDKERRFVVADIPGLIPGAHEGKGLGIKFLKHIERTKVLAQLIDISASVIAHPAQDDEELKAAALRDAIEQFETIERELERFSEALLEVPRIAVFSKADIPGVNEVAKQAAEYFKQKNIDLVIVSSATGAGLDQLKETLHTKIQELNAIA